MGALSLADRLDFIENEPPSAVDHAFTGARIIEGFAPLREVAQIIQYHHVPWNHGEGKMFFGKPVPILSHIVHLADRTAVLIDPTREVIGQVKDICNTICEQKNTRFAPELVDALLLLSKKEYIWFDLTYKPLLNIVEGIQSFSTLDLDLDGVIELARIFASVIDFRSPFTANHSAGVAKTAEKLAELAGFSPYERKMMLVSGYLHDLGKLSVNNEILEKPDKLNPEEFNIIKKHPFYTYRLLQTVSGFETINKWASFHHEKLSGRGYPFRLTGDDIPLGSRIMAVSDVFTAIAEERPYREGMRRNQIVDVLNAMVKDLSLCPYVVAILLNHFDQINVVRKLAQQNAASQYARLRWSHSNKAAVLLPLCNTP